MFDLVRLKHLGFGIVLALTALGQVLEPACMAKEGAESASRTVTRYEEAIPRPHGEIETLRYLGYLYLINVAGYLYLSHNEVFNNASITRYFQNFGSIAIFDQDEPGANWGQHLATGAIVYEFYRARSYSKNDAFLLTLAQECLFQFTIETLLFPTGFENVVNTSVIGTILGRGLELASFPLLNSNFFLFKFFGYLLNIPVLLGLHENKKTMRTTASLLPFTGPAGSGLELRLRF